MNARTRIAVLGMLILGLMSSGCSRLHSKAAIKDAVDAHLKQQPGLALANMTTEVQEVQFTGDTAVAQVVFRSKEAPELKVEVRYNLRREGDHWEVQSSAPMGGQGGNPHGQASNPHGSMGSEAANPMTVPANPPAQISPQPSH